MTICDAGEEHSCVPMRQDTHGRIAVPTEIVAIGSEEGQLQNWKVSK